MQQYQFEKIYSQMEKEFGTIERGDEDLHTMMFYPLESNLLKTHRQYPSSNSRRLREAIGLVFYDIKSRYTGEQYDLDNIRDKDNARLEFALLMAFDPFTNEELRATLTSELHMDLTDKSLLYDRLPCAAERICRYVGKKAWLKRLLYVCRELYRLSDQRKRSDLCRNGAVAAV